MVANSIAGHGIQDISDKSARLGIGQINDHQFDVIGDAVIECTDKAVAFSTSCACAKALTELVARLPCQ
jgi:hypothetical protein